MYLLPTENKRIVGFETLLAQAMNATSAVLPVDGFSTALAQYSAYSPPVYEDVGDEGPFLAVSGALTE